MLRIILLLASFTALANAMSDLDEFMKKLEEDYKKYGKDKVFEDLELEWQDYMKKYGKEYTPEEKKMRLERLRKHKKIVKSHNQLHKQGKVSYRIHMNHLADLTHDEYHAMNGFKPRNESVHRGGSRLQKRQYGEYEIFKYDQNAQVPESVDWRKKGLVGPVKNQGQCGSCYAFSSTGGLEAYHKKKSSKMVSLSEQNIIDCSWRYGNNGCDGGNQNAVFSFTHDNGVTTTEHYPYTGNASHNCKSVNADLVRNEKTVGIVSNSEDAMKHAVATVGPVSIAITAGIKGFQLYQTGVFSDPACAGKQVDHGVLAVGYGVDPEHGDYWIVKNSWGPHWGKDGYIWMARNKNNMCNIGKFVSWPK